jgi:hypothetical protein
MAARTELCVRVETRRGDTLSELMSSMRVWLDRRAIDVVSFTSLPTKDGLVAFNVCFRTESDVVLFRQEFGDDTFRQFGSIAA